MKLTGNVHEVPRLSQSDITAMFRLMSEFYDNMDFDVFKKDLNAKDFCILLYDEAGKIQGFSTQKILTLDINGKQVSGLFSGDTIIHKDYWGSPELFRAFTSYFIEYAKRHEEFYWFLTSKGYKTYKIIAKFFLEFYPTFKRPTPPYEKSIMDAYASLLYPDEYDPADSVIKYKNAKDKLKKGVADITPSVLRDEDVTFFLSANPQHYNGNDLVCLAKISDNNLAPFAKKRFIGK